MKKILQHPRVRLHLKQGSRFIVCGLIGATMEFSILRVLVGMYHVSPFIAFIFSGGIPAVFVFLFNKHITFGDRDAAVGHQTTRFIAVYGLAFILNYGLSSGFYTLGFHAFMGTVVFGISVQRQHVAYLAKALAIGCTAVWNYFFSHYFIFRRNPVPIAADVAGLL